MCFSNETSSSIFDVPELKVWKTYRQATRRMRRVIKEVKGKCCTEAEVICLPGRRTLVPLLAIPLALSPRDKSSYFLLLLLLTRAEVTSNRSSLKSNMVFVLTLPWSHTQKKTKVAADRSKKVPDRSTVFSRTHVLQCTIKRILWQSTWNFIYLTCSFKCVKQFRQRLRVVKNVAS